MNVSRFGIPCNRYRWYVFHSKLDFYTSKQKMIIQWNHSFVSSAITFLRNSFWEVHHIPQVTYDGFESSIFWEVRAGNSSESLGRLRENQRYLIQFRTVSSKGFTMWQNNSLSKIQPQIPLISLCNSYIFSRSDIDLWNCRFAVFYLGRNCYDIEMTEVFSPEVPNKRIIRKSEIIMDNLREIRSNDENIYERNTRHCSICPFVSECQKT